MTMDRSAKRCVLIAAGGTGGHVIPGLEVAKTLRARGWECVFLGTDRGFENRLVPEAGFPLHLVPIGSFKRVSMRRRLTTLLSAPRALAEAVKVVRQRGPEVALSLGGYAAGPLVAACALLEVPLVVLEPNALPGLANRLAAPAARRALLGNRRASSYFRAASCEVTGMPVRSQFFRTEPRPADEPFTVLILGGSQGATRLNQAALEASRIWRREGRLAPRLLHQTGEREHEQVSTGYRELGLDARTAPFFDNMPELFAASDLVVCRAGASVLAELCAARKPAVLVPFPYAADDHQRANGAVLAAAGGAVVVEDRDWTGERMVREIEALEGHPVRLAEMARALAPLAPIGAARQAADAIAEAADRAGGIV